MTPGLVAEWALTSILVVVAAYLFLALVFWVIESVNE